MKSINILLSFIFLFASTVLLCTENKAPQPESFFNRWFYSSSEQKERAYHTLQDLLVRKDVLEAKLWESDAKQQQEIIKKINDIQKHIDEQKIILGQKWSKAKKLAVAATQALGLGVLGYYGAPLIKKMYIKKFSGTTPTTPPQVIIDPGITIDPNNSDHLIFSYPINTNFSYQWYKFEKNGNETLLQGQTNPTELTAAKETDGFTYILKITNTFNGPHQLNDKYIVKIYIGANQGSYKLREKPDDFFSITDFTLFVDPTVYKLDLIFSKIKYEENHPGFKFNDNDVDDAMRGLYKKYYDDSL